MREVPVPAPDLPPLQRSVIACLAAIVEVDPGAVPAPGAGHPAPWTVWRNWLGRRGLGLVPVRDPAAFGWPGPWLALLRSGAEGGRVAAVAFGVPPGIVWNPLGGDEPFDAVEEGYVVAPADAALWAPTRPDGARAGGRVEALAIAPDAEAPMTLLGEATAVAGRGLEGDRYFDGRGTFSDPHARGGHLTLIEAEVLDDLSSGSAPLGPLDARRNVVTRGVDLNALVGRRFRVGPVACEGQRLCEPCAHLERLTRPGTLRALVHRGGLRADIVAGGVMRVGDEIVPL